MILKKHIIRDKTLIAICDSDLLGKKIEKDNLVLDLTSSFFMGEQKTEEEVLMELNNYSSITAVGVKTISLLISKKIISEKNVKKIKDIPYIFIFNF